MDAKTNNPPRPRQGFTLVEMLVVIAIIGILASLVTGAAVAVRKRVRVATIVNDISQLDLAINAYKEKFGDYPPDFTDAAAVTRHVARAFPRYPGTWQKDPELLEVFVDPTKLDPTTALIFWLGGIPELIDTNNDNTVDTLRKMKGFSADQRNPFARPTTVSGRIQPLFEFKPDQLKYEIANGKIVWLRYFPPYPAPEQGAPYVYFRAGDNGYATTVWTPPSPPWPTNTPPVPYSDTRTKDWVNAETYQIIAAGADGRFGTTTDGQPPRYPDGDNYFSNTADPDAKLKLGQHDNITNFSGGQLEDKMP